MRCKNMKIWLPTFYCYSSYPRPNRRQGVHFLENTRQTSRVMVSLYMENMGPGAVLSQWGMSGLCPRPAVARLNLGGDALCLWAAGQGSEGLLDASLDAASRSASQVATPAQRADGS